MLIVTTQKVKFSIVSEILKSNHLGYVDQEFLTFTRSDTIFTITDSWAMRL
jgi:hypothetical protein